MTGVSISTTTMNSLVPFHDFRRVYATSHRQIDAAIRRVFRRGQFILGPELAALEQEFAHLIHTKYAIGVNSGTDALVLALRVLGIGETDEVITVGNSFVATAMAITTVGATPVFADVDPETLIIDPAHVVRVLTPRTKAIIPVHLYGYPAPMDEIMAIARAHGLSVIEDACQAHGATYRGRPVGSIGDVGCFSFYPTKNLGAFGDAGAVTTNRLDFAECIRSLRNYGQDRTYHSVDIGVNSRLDELQAALVRWGIRKLSVWNRQRAQRAAWYRDGLKGLPLVLPLDGGARLERVWHVYVVRTPQRDELKAFLASRGIQTATHYPVPIFGQPAYTHLGYHARSYPHTQQAAQQALSLPLYPEMTRAEVTAVCCSINDFYGR